MRRPSTLRAPRRVAGEVGRRPTPVGHVSGKSRGNRPSSASTGNRSETGLSASPRRAALPRRRRAAGAGRCAPEAPRCAAPRALDPAPEQRLPQQPRGFGLQPVAARDMPRQPGIQGVEVEALRHEGNLVEADLQEPEGEVDQRGTRQVAAAVQVAPARRIGEIHPGLVFAAALEAPGEAARHRPEPVGADAGAVRHGMAHQTAHPAIAVRERVDVVEPVMGGRHGQDARRRTHPLEAVAPLEMRHERFHRAARRRGHGGPRRHRARAPRATPRAPCETGRGRTPRSASPRARRGRIRGAASG